MFISGYFNGGLFDLLEDEGHDYLVKVKLKNLCRLMLEQKSSFINEKESVCEFEYQAKDLEEVKNTQRHPYFNRIQTDQLLAKRKGNLPVV